MAGKIYKYFFYFFISLFFLLLVSTTFNSKLRHTGLHYLLNSYKVYMNVSIQAPLKVKGQDLFAARDKLLGFIKFSKKFSKGKNKLIVGLYDTANLVQSSITNEQDYGIFEEVFFEIVLLDPSLYEARTWYAKSLYANNKIKESFVQLNKAIEISPLDASPFRLAIKIATEQKNFDLVHSYCSRYIEAEFGGKMKRYTSTLHSGFNLNKFGVSFDTTNKDLDQNIYIFSGINLGSFDLHEVVPENSKNFNSLKLFFTFIPGTTLEIKNLIIHSDNEIYTIKEEDLIITANNAHFLERENLNLIIFTEENNEIVNLNLKKEYKNVEKILIEMRVSKLDILNLNCSSK